jgi:peptidyl-prolyl cis-trans isomerase SurA
MAYQVKTQSDVKAVANCVKKLKFDEWNEALRKTFNNDSIIRIRVEKGIFKKGDNALVDKMEFGVADAKVKPVKNFPNDAVYGKMLKAPEEMGDVKALVTADYQESMEKDWIKKLRAKYPVEVKWEMIDKLNITPNE